MSGSLEKISQGDAIDFGNKFINFLASSTLNDMFTHFEQLQYLDFYTLTKLSVTLPHSV
jgi:hypothetical protein